MNITILVNPDVLQGQPSAQVGDWLLTSLKEKLIKIGAKVVSDGRYVAFQMAASPSHGKC